MLKMINADVSPHTFRHTFATLGTDKAAIEPYNVQLVLHHSFGDVTHGTYMHGQQLDRKREALETWESYVESVRPKAGRNKSRIMSWIGYWPISLVWTVLDEIPHFFRQFSSGRLLNMGQTISDRPLSHVLRRADSRSFPKDRDSATCNNFYRIQSMERIERPALPPLRGLRVHFR